MATSESKRLDLLTWKVPSSPMFLNPITMPPCRWQMHSTASWLGPSACIQRGLCTSSKSVTNIKGCGERLGAGSLLIKKGKRMSGKKGSLWGAQREGRVTSRYKWRGKTGKWSNGIQFPINRWVKSHLLLHASKTLTTSIFIPQLVCLLWLHPDASQGEVFLPWKIRREINIDV